MSFKLNLESQGFVFTYVVWQKVFKFREHLVHGYWIPFVQNWLNKDKKVFKSFIIQIFCRGSGIYLLWYNVQLWQALWYHALNAINFEKSPTWQMSILSFFSLAFFWRVLQNSNVAILSKFLSLFWDFHKTYIPLFSKTQTFAAFLEPLLLAHPYLALFSGWDLLCLWKMNDSSWATGLVVYH